MNADQGILPPDLKVLERGWLSSNQIIMLGDRTAVVDTGYVTHAPQTLALTEHALAGRPLHLIVNTHLHSDHCGGNAALQACYPDARTLIPPGLAALVDMWDDDGLSYAPTGQQCPRFRFDGTLPVGGTMPLGLRDWHVIAAPGHDTHSVVLFEPQQRILISADALWERGFGVVFPELDGDGAFQAVADTLDVIEHLQPRIVIPGHGRVFTDVATALHIARQRLAGFQREPLKHALHAGKVLLKFKLLELRAIPCESLLDWACNTRYFQALHSRYFAQHAMRDWAQQLMADLVRSGAARVDEQGMALDA